MTTIDQMMVEAHEELENQPVVYFQLEADFEDTLGGESPLIL